MFTVNLTGIRETKKRLSSIKTDTSAILANAINRTAFMVRKGIQAEMKAKLDRPTPWLLKSIYVEQATPAKLEASIGPNDYFGANAWERVFRPHVFGGSRPQKPFESRLGVDRSGILPAGWFAVPGKHMPMDAYGNPRRGELTKMLSWIGALEQGNRNPRSRRKNKTQRAGESYFVAYPGRTKLPPGIYKRFGGKTLLMLLFVSHANYKKRIRWFETAKSIVDQELMKKIRGEIYKSSKK